MDNVAKEIIISSEGLEKLKKELEELKTVKRQEVAEKIETARSFGDLSENSEYDAAKNEQAQVEGRIAELEEQLKYARVLDENELTNETVHVGSRMTVQVDGAKKSIKYHIVGPMEADPFNGDISDDCPVGKALLTHHVGDSVEVETPKGTVTYKIVKISK
ncbi:MAG: transcription elongation factor GreA [Clostridia bacterium]|nr:transcription elongation factor GreA [Clostridia bacterium]